MIAPGARPSPDLEALEDAVTDALDRRAEGDLHVLGHGEIAVVVAWPPAQPRWACKRLPPFPSAEARDRHARLIERYVDDLRAAGVDVVDTQVRCFDRPDGAAIAYAVQPILPAATLGARVLREADPSPDHPLLDAVVSAVVGVTSDVLGLDAQITNWAWTDGRARYLDVTTPFLYTPDGRVEMDLEPFLSAGPAILRPYYRRDVPRLVLRWRRDPRPALVDFAGNLFKDRLDDWVPAACERINREVAESVTVGELVRFYDREVRLWPYYLRMKKADRWWRRNVRRTRYEFVLPERTDYDPASWKQRRKRWT